jgi:signal transduction histidine kinase/ActR/RegA family two-component response regulator
MGRDSEYVRAYADRYRAMFPIRIATIVGIVAICLWLVDWPWAFNFAACQFGLYALLWTVVEQARRNPGSAGAALRLKRWTEAITFALAAHCSLFVLAVVAMEPHYLRYVLLLIAGNLMVGALQVHISRLSFAAAVTPPALAIAVIAAIQPRWDASFKVAFAMFIAGVVGAAWRQMDTDRQAVELQVDLTARTDALERALAETEAERAQAERANQAKSRFLAMISHDVRTPLNIIMGVTEVLKRKTRAQAEQELIADMGDAGAMLLRLLNGALDLSKIESGQAEARLAPVDLRAALQATGRVWRRRADELGLHLTVEFDGQDADFRLLADEGRIEQVVVNLMSNAMKMTPSGLIRLRALARPDADGSVALDIEVHDQGPGVPEDKRDRIFQPFEQLDEGRAAGGAGLGLAICRAGVEAMGGEIGVREAEGGGAVFWFRIAADRVQAPVAVPPAASPEPLEARRLTILAAEDHPANRKLLALLLAQFDAEVVMAENGAEAVAAAASQPFDLILMDVMMPVMDGVAALQAIRGAGNRVPVHMLTANVFEEDVARYMAAGADGVLRKPIEIPALHAVLAGIGEAATAEPMRRAG